jgi:hypothetical protein
VINWTVIETESREELGNVNQTLATGDGTSQYDTDYWDDGFFLPVTLSSFTAVYQEGMPILQWITQSENNNSGWNIFRSESEDMELSMQINPELITGAGTTTEIQNYSFTDEYEIESGVTYFYQLESVDFLGLTEQFGPISIRIPDDGQGESPEVPVVYGLHNNYPNPFNPETMISFTPEVEGQVTIDILNIKGQIVKNLVKETIENNEIDILHSYIWDGSNNHGKYVSSGVYFYRYQSPKRIQINKMLMIK